MLVGGWSHLNQFCCWLPWVWMKASCFQLCIYLFWLFGKILSVKLRFDWSWDQSNQNLVLIGYRFCEPILHVYKWSFDLGLLFYSLRVCQWMTQRGQDFFVICRNCFFVNNNNCSVFYLFSLLAYWILNKRYFFNKFKSK